MHRTGCIRRALALIAVVPLLAAPLVSGCARVGTPDTGCAWKHQRIDGRATAAVAVLVDRTASMWHGRTGTASGWADTIRGALLADVRADGARSVALGWFDGALGAPHWLVNNAPLPEARGNAGNVDKQEDAITDCLDPEIEQVERAAPVRPGTDVLSAVSNGAAEVAGVAATRRRLTVITDGLPNRGCMDLRAPAEPTVIADRCRRSGELRPGMLRGVEVHLTGVGNGASAVDDAGRQWLTVLWQRVCAAANARASCVDGTQPPGTGAYVPANAAADAAVAPPAIVYHRGVSDIPASLLFATDSARIGDDAATVLAGVVSRIRQARARQVTVTGYTDSRGTAAHNADLSERRARAVADVLRRSGIRVTDVTGYGETKPQCEERPGGRMDVRCMARDRRVRVTYGSGGAA